MDLGNIQLKSQLITTVIHVLGNYLFVTVLEMSVYGTGIAALITNLCSFSYNYYYTSIREELKDINKVSFFDK